MVKFDKLKLKFDLRLLEYYDLSKFKLITIQKGQNFYEFYEWEKDENNQIPGLISIKIFHLNDKVELILSSKILGKDYINLINRNNFYKVIENINETGIIKLDPELILEEAQVLLCDATYNLKMDTELSEYFYSLNMLAVINHNYMVQLYPKKYYKNNAISLTGITISSRIRRNKAALGETITNNEYERKRKRRCKRLMFYDKYKEIKRNKDKYWFLSEKEKEQFKNIFRIEGSYRTFNLMRKYFNLPKGEIKLKDLLYSNEPVNEKLLREIINPKLFRPILLNNIVFPTTKMAIVKEKKRINNLIKFKNNFRFIANAIKITRRRVSYHLSKHLESYFRENHRVLENALKDYIKILIKLKEANCE